MGCFQGYFPVPFFPGGPPYLKVVGVSLWGLWHKLRTYFTALYTWQSEKGSSEKPNNFLSNLDSCLLTV